MHKSMHYTNENLGKKVPYFLQAQWTVFVIINSFYVIYEWMMHII